MALLNTYDHKNVPINTFGPYIKKVKRWKEMKAKAHKKKSKN